MKQGEKALLRAKAKVLKALAHPTRLWMVEKLTDGERCVCEFVDRVDVDFSTISRHLTILRQAGVISSEKRGKQVFYTLKVPCVNNFMHCIEAVIESQARDQFALIDRG